MAIAQIPWCHISIGKDWAIIEHYPNPLSKYYNSRSMISCQIEPLEKSAWFESRIKNCAQSTFLMDLPIFSTSIIFPLFYFAQLIIISPPIVVPLHCIGPKCAPLFSIWSFKILFLHIVCAIASTLCME